MNRWDQVDDSYSDDEGDNFHDVTAMLANFMRLTQLFGQSMRGKLLDNASIHRNHMEMMDRMRDPQFHHVRNPGFDGVSCGFVSKAPVESLTKVSALAELRLGHVNHGTILWCKVVAPVLRIVGLLVLVEDASKQWFHLALYNFMDCQASLAECQRALPVGTVLGVKEPYVKTFASGHVGVRVDNPPNVIVQRPKEKATASAGLATKSMGELKAEGNKHYGAGDFAAAEACYSAALKNPPAEALTTDMTVALLNNRANCGLQRQAFAQALADADDALQLAPTNVKSKFRRAMALTWLRRHAESQAILKALPPSKDVVKWRAVVARRVAENVFGQFSLSDLENGTIVEDYIGPVEVRMSPGKGRGLFLTRRVRKGELLLVEKAYATSMAVADVDLTLVTPMVDWSASKMYTKEEESLLKAVVAKSQARPIDLARLCCLYDGTTPNPILPPMSLFRTDEIQPSMAYEPPSVTQIRGILVANTFQAPKTDDSYGVALFMVSSFLNHAQGPNTMATALGPLNNFRAFRAGQDLDAGEELTTWCRDIPTWEDA